MNPYFEMVSEYARWAREGKGFALGKYPRCPRPQVALDAPKVLLFSPHPDDEVIVGALPLRLLRKSRWNVINVAVTHGSRKERQAERLEELKACCDCIGFGLRQTVNLKTRAEDRAAWTRLVGVVSEILLREAPRVVFLPHEADWNGTHIGTHHLVMDALATLPGSFSCHLVETEFWQAMTSPNLMVEVSLQELADLMTALSFHAGEVRRNPYHLSLPAWMVDNVRRGSELIGGQGGVAPVYTFAALHRVRRWSQQRLEEVCLPGRYLGSREDPANLFEG